MGRSTTNELLAEILIIKDLYICGRMNYDISQVVFEAGKNMKYSKENWAKYEVLSETYIDNSVKEFLNKKEELELRVKESDVDVLDIIVDTKADEFDGELFNDIMKEFYGGRDTLSFVTAYNKYSNEFNTIIKEYFL